MMFQKFIKNTFSLSLWRDEEGATAVEYALLVGLIAVVMITAVSTLGTGIYNKFVDTYCSIKSNGTYTAPADTTPPTKRPLTC
jgi:pilus assembly protein Flp/PilA